MPHRFGLPAAASVFVGLAIATRLMQRRDDRDFYRSLRQPPLAPPPAAFGIVWSGLNVLQLWADLQILNDRANPRRGPLLALRGLNWLLYLSFVPSFFRLRSPVLGEAVTVAQGLNTMATILAARRDTPKAALALLPPLGWLGFAGYIGGWTAAHNRDPLLRRLRGR
jgi:tryptophan-rich sensory protein